MWFSGRMSNSPMALKLKPEQQELLETWVRAHGTPQQVVTRCRIVLLAHQGSSDLTIADELGVNRDTCRQAKALCGRGTKRLVGGGRGTRTPTAIRISGTDHQCDSADQAEGSDALELAYDGESARSACEHGATYLAGAWVTAAPPGDLQALERPAFRGEALGCGGGVLEPAAECGGAVR